MEKIQPIFVTDGGEDWFDIAQKGAKMGCARTGNFGLAIRDSAPTKYASTTELETAYRPTGKYFISNDHAATYGIAQGRGKLTLIVFDAHLDIYGREGKLDKSNVLRCLDETGDVLKIIFVGTRASEELVYQMHHRKVDEANLEFAERWRINGTFQQTAAQIEVIPADSVSGFVDGLSKALHLAGEATIGIDVDLDVFEGLAGVQYDGNFGKNIEKFVAQREEWAKMNGIEIDEEKKKEILDYARFCRNMAEEKGIESKVDFDAARKILFKISSQLAFFHITEYDDGKDGMLETADFCNKLLAAARV